MTTFPGSPRLIKGAIVALDSSSNRVVSTVSFQYNPETLSRTLQVQAIEGEAGAQSEALRLKGAPIETMRLDVEIDATDRLEQADNTAVSLGIYPQLSALEILVYPQSSQVAANMEKASRGTLEIIPTEAPLTLLVWGKQRVLPVRLTDFSITEEAYDVNLNPIRAKVSLSLRVLNYNDLPWGQRGSRLFLTHHRNKEQMAKRGNIANPSAVTGVNVDRL
jgi:Contractile injection system tube protein